MTLANLKVIRVVCRCDLNDTGSKFHIYILVCNNRNLTVHKRKHNGLADDILVTIICRIDSHCGISQHGLRTGRSKFYISARLSNDLVFHMPEMSCLLYVLYLCIRNRGLADRTPVDDTVALIDIALII